MKNILTITGAFLLLSLAINATAQEVWDGCPAHGDNPKEYAADLLKNRYVIPKHYEDFDLNKMIGMKCTDNTSQDKAVRVKGYVIVVKFGGSETCNCHTKNPDDYDVHIVLSKSESDIDVKDGVVVELTPRLRNELNNNWTRNKVKSLFYHKWVYVSGYLFDDKEHKAMSAADNANPGNTHRATCWEIHPVTNIELAD